MSADTLRAYVTVLTRDLLPPAVGTFLSVYLPVTGQFEWWQAPLIAGLFGVTLVPLASKALGLSGGLDGKDDG